MAWTEGRQEVPLFRNLAVDIFAAGGSALLVSPFITIVDRSITENAARTKRLYTGLAEYSESFVRHPLKFIQRREFQLIYGLYFSTYVTANAIDSTYEALGRDSQWPKFFGTTAVNLSLCVLKDRAFARMFGVGAPRGLPSLSYLLFALRDSLTIAAAFNLPTLFESRLRKMEWEDRSAVMTAQLLSPCAVQFASTPLHLMGLDLYNHPAHTVRERITFIRGEYLKSTLARIGRIGPAFGFGGIGNRYLRFKGRTVMASAPSVQPTMKPTYKNETDTRGRMLSRP